GGRWRARPVDDAREKRGTRREPRPPDPFVCAWSERRTAPAPGKAPAPGHHFGYYWHISEDDPPRGFCAQRSVADPGQRHAYSPGAVESLRERPRRDAGRWSAAARCRE